VALKGKNSNESATVILKDNARNTLKKGKTRELRNRINS
jgi:hypothetical protein